MYTYVIKKFRASEKQFSPQNTIKRPVVKTHIYCVHVVIHVISTSIMSLERLSEWMPITSLHIGLCHSASMYFLWLGYLIFKYCHCNPVFNNPTQISITRRSVEGYSETSHVSFKNGNNINIYWKRIRKQQRSVILLCNTDCEECA